MGELIARSIILSSSKLSWTEDKEVLQVKGLILGPGVWKGLDGRQTNYTKEVLSQPSAFQSFVGKPILVKHSDEEKVEKDQVVGWWFGAAYGIDIDPSDGREKEGIWTKGYVFSPEGKVYVKTHPDVGFSIEADVAEELGPNGIWDARKLSGTGTALVDNPACVYAGIAEVLPKQLSGGIKKMPNDKPVIQGEIPKKAEIAEKPPNPHDAKCLVLRAMQRRKPPVPPDEEKPPEEEEEPYPAPYPTPAGVRRRRVPVRAAELAKQCAEVNKEPCPFATSTEEVMLEQWDFSEAIASAVEKAMSPLGLEERLGEMKATGDFLKTEAKRLADARINAVQLEIQKVKPDFDAPKFLEKLGVSDASQGIKLLEAFRDEVKVLSIPKVDKPVLEGKKLEEFNTRFDAQARALLPPEMYEHTYGKKEK